MVKRTLFLILGFGMIAVGFAGVTTTLVDHTNQAAIKQLEMAQEQTKAAAAQEQKTMEAKRQEIDQLAMRVQEEKQQVEAEHRRAEEAKRLREAANQRHEETKAASSEASVPKKDPTRNNESHAAKKRSVLSRKDQKPAKDKISQKHPSKSLASRPSKSYAAQGADIKRISRKAGLEAARLFGPVQYFNPETGDLVLAEPFDVGPDAVRVRVRVWKHRRLLNDNVISFSEASLRTLRGPRA